MYCEKGTVQIARADNGYTVTMRDPKIEEQNAKRSLNRDKPNSAMQPYVDPTKTYVFEKIEKMQAFLTANLDKALPKVEYASAFEALGDPDD